jgi:hypothetical protein
VRDRRLWLVVNPKPYAADGGEATLKVYGVRRRPGVQAALTLVVEPILADFLTSLPLMRVAPARTSGTRWGALTPRHRCFGSHGA